MWFIAGLMLGSAMSSDGGSSPKIPSALGDIPFRCFVALDDGDGAYRECRRLSMTLQLSQQITNTNEEVTGYVRGTLRSKVDDAISLEVRGLRQLEKTAHAAIPKSGDR